MAIKSITYKREFPVELNMFKVKGRYTEMCEQLDRLRVGVGVLCVSIPNKPERDSARAYAHLYARDQDSKKNGWRYQTAARGGILYIRKVHYGGDNANGNSL